ncbi:valine--tRNA ligase [Fuerstiella marisgermanici]|uniref:Valine--tRNA ligase n=1 Tax=Fuerstiella marisgermanici TaxID=1891926 RepID=A0A1P8WI53_9PLAN|nr:valine--tRNA ligase [Fuerstiella marisgermanici]APZ93738.1 Valine--tRNA ligase [Fuerstiella marisgermanici]
MTVELPKAYEPSAAQARWVSEWESRGYCNADPQTDRESHTIMIPLPNVTGALHMGHCLNGTVQDLLTRWRRMQGREALWMPGTDHAGIATQAVVERRMLEEEGLTRRDIGRDALVERIWKWKDEYEVRILNQLKQIGASCDWRRVRFTLDDVCSKAVRRTFFKMFCDGYIFRGKRLVNWDPHLQTAVADDEVFTEDVDGHFWTFNYPVVDDDGQPTGQKIKYSTTRPETMLGDTAVCVHPTDERYTDLVGKFVQIPVNGRLIPIIADALLADKELGTGAVKVTPAHDPNDYACGLRNDLEMINILNPDGTINEEGGEFQGLTMAEARKAVVAKMDELGHLEGVEDRKIPKKFSDRSKTEIEPYLSDQWFVKMDELAQSAMDAVSDKRVRIFPQRYTKTYMDWLGEKRDWCISRQLWWGHRIPIWSRVLQLSEDPESQQYDKYQAEFALTAALAPSPTPEPPFTEWAFHSEPVNSDSSATAARHLFLNDQQVDGVSYVSLPSDDGKEILVLACVDADREGLEERLSANGFEQDPDVLDTWFSSALWPHATLGWPDTENNPPLQSGERKAESGSPESRKPKTENSSNAVLDYFYPGSVLVTSRDIITLWVARMVLTGLYNMGDVPFQHVYIHPKILDGLGQTMSKSKGNGVDPLELIEKYGTDAVRFTIASLCGETQDVRLPVGYECPHCEAITPQTAKHQKMAPRGGETPSIKCKGCKKSFQFPSPWFTPDEGAPVARIVSERFEFGRNFCNKLWNASRFAFMNLEGYTPGEIDPADLQTEDKWILSRLATTAQAVTTMLERYQFDKATHTIRDFTWNEFCDWYVEMVKPRLKDDAARPVAQRMLVVVIDNLLKLLHPFAPFITEELWQKLNELAPVRGLAEQTEAAESVMIASWPDLPGDLISEELESRFERLQEIIVAVRNIRGQYKISPKEPLKLFMKCAPEVADQMQAVADQFDNLARTMLEAAGLDITPPAGAASFSLKDADGYIPLDGLVDTSAEKAKLQKQADELENQIAGSEKKLSNPSFVDKAPDHVVEAFRKTLAERQAQLESVKRLIDEMG